MSGETFGKEQKEKRICWRCSKLKSLGLGSKVKIELRGESTGLDGLTESLKSIMNQKYEVEYSINVKEEFLNGISPSSKIVVGHVLTRSNHAI